MVRGPARLAANHGDLRGTLAFFELIESTAAGCDQPLLLDLYDAVHIDPPACVLLAAAIQRCRIVYQLKVDVRMPRKGVARFALAIFGVAHDERIDRSLLEKAEPQVMKVTSGTRGDPSPGALTFEIARLAEGLVADEKLADRVHAALNEAADNVLSWAYGAPDSPPNAAERWWVAGLLANQTASFIALDLGAGIPATAPQNLGDALTGLIRGMMQDREWRQLNLRPTDSQVLLATIRQRRTVSGLDERGKGLSSMIALIDLFPDSFINIFSGNAVYSYRNPAATDGEREHCGPLGFQFPGTLVVWHLQAQTSEART